MPLAATRNGTSTPGRPTLVLMHFLGGSTREWDEVIALLGPAYDTLAIDLAGFGASHGEPGYTLDQMCAAVSEALAPLASYVLVGHSMAGKISTILARRAEDSGDARLKGLVLVAGSPPGPEPMSDSKRSEMLGALGGAPRAEDYAAAKQFIGKNEQRDLSPEVLERATQEVLKMNRTAWVAWLQHGSKEDWAERVGILSLPALVVAGDKDASLGPDGQRETMLPHIGNGRMHVVRGSSHLVPMERPEELTQLLRDFVAALPAPAIPTSYQAFMDSDRVAPNTLAVLEARLQARGKTTAPLDARQQRVLRAALGRIVPQNTIDLAGPILARLASGQTDGWRYDILPPDLEAYRQQLDGLAKDDFENLDAKAQDGLLEGLCDEASTPSARWFEDLRADAVAAYLAHPATLARLGYSGIGVGGAGTPHRGFVDLQPNGREAWEPLPAIENEAAR